MTTRQTAPVRPLPDDAGGQDKVRAHHERDSEIGATHAYIGRLCAPLFDMTFFLWRYSKKCCANTSHHDARHPHINRLGCHAHTHAPAFLAICIIGALRERMRMLTPALRSSPSTRSRNSPSAKSRFNPQADHDHDHKSAKYRALG